MAAVYRVLGQAYPAAAVETDLYTCATLSAVVSTLAICNNSAVADAITVRVCPAGAISANKHLLLSGTALAANAVMTMTMGMTLAATDVVRVTSSNGTTAFTMFGQENV